MIASPRVCKRCKKTTRNFQKADNAWCLDCRNEMKPKGHLYCSGCGKAVYETYTPQHLCSMCAFAAKVGTSNAKTEFKQSKAEEIAQAIKAKEKELQKGDVRKLPAVNSPLWTSQWAVMGSGATPYIVSHKKDGEWQCSCPAWTRNTPREDCKHILRVKLAENVPSAPKTMTVTVEVGGSLKPKVGRKFR